MKKIKLLLLLLGVFILSGCNITKDSMEDILNSSKYINTINNFNNNKAYLDICKHCSYKERFNKKNYY